MPLVRGCQELLVTNKKIFYLNIWLLVEVRSCAAVQYKNRLRPVGHFKGALCQIGYLAILVLISGEQI